MENVTFQRFVCAQFWSTLFVFTRAVEQVAMLCLRTHSFDDNVAVKPMSGSGVLTQCR